jgi:hypothetical protein
MEQTTSPDTPETTSLSKKDHFNVKPFEKYFVGKNPDLLGYTIIGIAAGLRLDFPRGLLEPPKEAFNIISKMCPPRDGDTFGEICLDAYKNFNGPKIRNINDAWFEIARLIQIGIKPKSQPEIKWSDEEKEKDEEEETTPLKLVPKRTTQNTPQHAPAATLHVQKIPEEKLPAWVTENEPLAPKIAPARKESIIEFVTNHSPSFNYRKVFIFISRHTKNRFSKKGRKVYPYGQEYVARKLNLSLHTIENVFSWLRRQGIIIKRSNENPELKKSATWFVCTSWKQSFYFRDPKGLRSKNGSRRSLMKRRFHLVNT